jgi:hypothetical protein
MRTRRSLCAVVVALAILGTNTPAAAQTDLSTIAPQPGRVDLSASTGLMFSTDWSDLVLIGSRSPASGTVEQVLARDLLVEPGPVFDATVTYWEGRYGFRVHTGFARSCLAVGRTCGDLAGGGATRSVDVDRWMYDIGGAIGLTDYRRGRWVWPYAIIGLGGVTYDLERTIGPPLTFIERPPVGDPSREVIVGNPDELLIAIDELSLETRLALNVGIGSDFRIPLGPAALGVRVEVSDHIHRSPVGILIMDVGSSRRGRSDSQLEFGVVHNLRAAAGLVVQFGR